MKIGIIGFGNMGSAIAWRIKSKYSILVFDKDANKGNNISGIKVSMNSIDLVKAVDAVILAVKPQDFALVLKEIGHYAKDKLVISIAAGITTGFIEKALKGSRVVRVMPNLPAKIGQGMSCIAKGKSATKEDLKFSNRVFSRLGKTLVVKEDMMPAVTAVSGSGPGFFYSFLESQKIKFIKAPMSVKRSFDVELKIAAEAVGFREKEAKLLAYTTTSGSIGLLRLSGLSPRQLRIRVASKGGTTEAGLNKLRQGGTLVEAVKAAVKKARELSKKE